MNTEKNKQQIIDQISGDQSSFIESLLMNYSNYRSTDAFSIFKSIHEDLSLSIEVRARAFIIMFVYFPAGEKKWNFLIYLNRLYNKKYLDPDNPCSIEDITPNDPDVFELQNLVLIENIRNTALSIIEELKFDHNSRTTAFAMLLLLTADTGLSDELEKKLQHHFDDGLLTRFIPYGLLFDEHMGYLIARIGHFKKR